MTWTPERIATVKSAVDFAAGCTPAYAEVRITGDEFREIVTLARLANALEAATQWRIETLALHRCDPEPSALASGSEWHSKDGSGSGEGGD